MKIAAECLKLKKNSCCLHKVAFHRHVAPIAGTHAILRYRIIAGGLEDIHTRHISHVSECGTIIDFATLQIDVKSSQENLYFEKCTISREV